MGTFPGAAYFRNPEPVAREAFRRILDWAGRAQQATVSDLTIQARLHAGAGGTYLWVLNPNRAEKTLTVTLQQGPWKSATRLWGAGGPKLDGNSVTITIADRDAAVIRLE